MFTPNAVKCNVCENRTGNKGEWGKSCKAYPDGIPIEIFGELDRPTFKHCNDTEYSFAPPPSMRPDEDGQ